MGVIEDVAIKAAIVLVVEGGEYDARAKRPRRAQVLCRLADRQEIEALAKLLAVSDAVTDYAWMTTPTRTFVFVTGDRDSVLAQFGYFDGWLRSESWPGGDRELSNGADLAAWLATNVGPLK